MKRVTIMAGGTGGHIFPGLAVAEALKKRGVTVDWLGASGGMEMELVPAHGVPITAVPIQALRGKGLGQLFRLPWRLLRAVLQARNALKSGPSKSTEHAVLSMGGYVAAPGGLAARWLGLPLLVHEQNSVLGLTNRILARWAEKVLTGFELPDLKNARWVGNPVRKAIVAVGQQRAARAYQGRSGESSTAPVKVLVLGGSQGAHSLNTRLPAHLAEYLKSGAIAVRHQSGKNKSDSAHAAYAKAGITHNQNLTIEPFIADMAKAYEWADVVIARAGALSMAEIQVAALPALYVPFPQAVDDHQRKNAEYAVEHGAALMWQESDDVKALKDGLKALIESAEKRRSLAEKAHALAKSDAADAVAEACLEAMGK